MSNVTILIPCHNSALYLGETLESLLCSAALIDARIVLADGGSTDYTQSVFDYFLRKYPSCPIDFRQFPDIHPAERINRLMQELDAEYIFLCHSDDIYIPAAMREMLAIIQGGTMWGLGAQCGFFEHPPDAVEGRAIPYTGYHMTHPQNPNQIYCEMPLWWSFSWNTALIRPKPIIDAGIRLDSVKYHYSNDYAFNWELAKRGKLETVDFCSTITRHRSSGDGPSNLACLTAECAEIRGMIQREIGLEGFLGPHFISVLRSAKYAYEAWDLSSGGYSSDQYLALSDRLWEFSLLSRRHAHFETLSKSLAKSVNKGSRLD